MEIILTIGIPTYNGGTHIKEALESIITQIDPQIYNKVEVVVIDNASTDATQDILIEYKNNFPNLIQTFRNSSNVGFDKNTDLLFKKSKGKFVWLLGDDDALKTNSIKEVIHIIESNPSIKVIQVNFDKYDKELKTIIEKVDIDKDYYCKDASTFHMKCRGRWGAIAALVISRQAWNQCDLTSAFGSQVIFGYALFNILLHGDSYIVSSPLVKVRDGSEKAVATGDGNARLNIAMASGILYRSMKDMGYSKNVAEIYLTEDRKYLYNAIPLAKYWGIKDKIGICRNLIRTHNSIQLWIKWIPIIYTPDYLYRAYYQIRNKLSSKLKPIERQIKSYLKNQ